MIGLGWAWLLLRLSGWAKALGGALKAAADWAARNPAWALSAALAALCLLCWHEWEVKARQVSTLNAANATMRHDLDVSAASIQTLQASIAKQNDQIKALGSASATAQAQGDQADQAALDRSKHRADLANQIATAPAPAAGTCRTPDAVMAAKGEL